MPTRTHISPRTYPQFEKHPRTSLQKEIFDTSKPKSYKLLLVIGVSPEMCIANLETKMKSALRWSSENYKEN